jgi:hypothetical protein
MKKLATASQSAPRWNPSGNTPGKLKQMWDNGKSYLEMARGN